MTEGMVIDLGMKTMMIVLYISAPLLGFGLVAGLIVSVFQAVTSIQEMTLTFVPKILAVILAMILFGGWMLRMILDFASDLLMQIPYVIR